MKKQFVSLLLLVVVLGSVYALLNSASSLSTVTTTFTSTYMATVTRYTTVSTIYTTYVTTNNMVIPPESTIPYSDRIYYWFGLKAGDTIRVKVQNAKGCQMYIERSGVGYLGGPTVGIVFFDSDEYEEKTFQVQKDGDYLVAFIWPSTSTVSASITAYRTEIYSVTSSSFLVQQYVTNVLTETSFTKTETVTGWFESQTGIVAIVTVATIFAIIAVVLMKRKPKPKQTQLEKYA